MCQVRNKDVEVYLTLSRGLHYYGRPFSGTYILRSLDLTDRSLSGHFYRYSVYGIRYTVYGRMLPMYACVSRL